MLYRLTMLFAATLLMGGCMRLTPTAAIDACNYWRPISWSLKDTPATVEGVKINNARQQAWCKK